MRKGCDAMLTSDVRCGQPESAHGPGLGQVGHAYVGPTTDELVDAMLAYRDLNACFRLQRAPSDALMGRLAKAEQVTAAVLRRRDGKEEPGGAR